MLGFEAAEGGDLGLEVWMGGQLGREWLGSGGDLGEGEKLGRWEKGEGKI